MKDMWPFLIALVVALLVVTFSPTLVLFYWSSLWVDCLALAFPIIFGGPDDFQREVLCALKSNEPGSGA